ncbi:MAG: Rha family transcriptional regulator [Thiolinea sp.]
MAKKQVTTIEQVKTTQTTTIETDTLSLPVLASTETNERQLPILEVIEGKVFCTSQQVAFSYKKEHFHVLRDIEEHIAKIKVGRHSGKEADMFLKGFDEVPNNLGFKVKKPIYYMNRRGFIKLITGFKGLEASDTTMDIIDLFDEMEAKLLNLTGIPEKPVKYLSNAQTQVLKQRVERLVTPIWIQQSYISTIWNRLRFVANADNQNTIPADQYDALMEELDRMEHTMTGDHGGYKLLEEFHDYLYRQILCLGTPLSMTVRKNWFAKFGSLLPKNISWRKAALMLEEAA